VLVVTKMYFKAETVGVEAIYWVYGSRWSLTEILARI